MYETTIQKDIEQILPNAIYQSGFQQGFNATAHVLTIHNSIQHKVDIDEHIHIIQLHISKAYDSVHLKGFCGMWVCVVIYVTLLMH